MNAGCSIGYEIGDMANYPFQSALARQINTIGMNAGVTVLGFGSLCTMVEYYEVSGSMGCALMIALTGLGISLTSHGLARLVEKVSCPEGSPKAA